MEEMIQQEEKVSTQDLYQENLGFLQIKDQEKNQMITRKMSQQMDSLISRRMSQQIIDHSGERRMKKIQIHAMLNDGESDLHTKYDHDVEQLRLSPNSQMMRPYMGSHSGPRICSPKLDKYFNQKKSGNIFNDEMFKGLKNS